MKTLKLLSLATALLALLVCAALAAVVHGPYAAWLLLFIGGAVLARPTLRPQLCTATLTVGEILLDVIDAFAKQLPGLASMGTDFRAESLKLGNTYTAHIATVPTTETITNANYGNMNGQNARDLLVDVPVTASKHIGCKLKWKHLDAIKDQKNEYAKVIALAAYSMAKSVIDDIITGFTPDNFTQHSVFSVANSDADMLDDICGDMNGVGALPTGRAMLVNTPVATVLAGDSRLTSRDYADQRVRGNGYRRWTDTNGFASIQEYPDLSNSTSGTAITGTWEADDDLFTTTGVVPATGQTFTLTAITNGAGLTQGNVYYAIRVSATTMKAASSYANAVAGTAIDVTTDGTAVTITPTQTLTGFAWDPRAIALLGGIPDDFNQDFLGLPVTRVMTMEVVTHPDLGISMAAVMWQEAGTGDIYLVPTLVYGKALGRQAVTNAVGNKTDYAGHRLVSA